MRNKKNDKLLILLASLIFIITIIVVIFLVTKKQKPNNDIDLPETDIQVAEMMIVPNNEGIQLVNMEGTILDKIDGEIVFHSNENNDIMYLKDNSFYTLNIKNDKENKKTILIENKVLDVNKSDDFRFNDSYIVSLTKITDKSKIEKFESKNKPKTNKDVSPIIQPNTITASSNFYNVSFIDKKTLKEVNKIEGIELDNFIIHNNYFIYSRGNYVYSFNIDNSKTKELYLGKRISDLEIVKDNIIIFDKFGNGSNKSLILRTNDDLEVNKASKHDASNIMAIQKDKDEETIVYIEDDKTPILYMLNLDGDRETKKKKSLNLDIQQKYSQDNTIYAKGYVYTAKDGRLNIIDLKSSTLYKTFDIDANFIYPVFSDSNLITK